MDVEHQGIDLVLTSYYDWSGSADTTFTFAFNYNEIEVTDQAQVNGVNPVRDSLVDDIENNYPEERFRLYRQHPLCARLVVHVPRKLVGQALR